MKKSKNSAKGIIIRYLILLVVAIPNLWIFYTIFTPLTVYPVYSLLKLFFDAALLSGNIIILNQSVPIEIIPSCVAGSAYYLLLMLNLFTPNIKTKERLKLISLAFLTFLLINIIRIFLLSSLAVSGSSLFDITHKIFWYSMSVVFVVSIWFYQVRKFKIKETPLYSDIKYLYKLSRGK